jgi:hypothetical protein
MRARTMKPRRHGSRLAILAGCGALTLVLAGVADAAYSTARLSVTYAPGGVTRIVASSAATDDATARAAIIVSPGTTLTTTAAPGTKVGTVTAKVQAVALSNALLPLSGDIVVAAPGTVPTAQQTACIGALPPLLTFVLALQAAGQAITIPAYLVPVDATLGELGSNQLVFCLAPPDLPVDKGGAPFGAKFLSADMSFTGIFSPLPEAIWTGIWTPWQPATGVVNQAGTIATPDLLIPSVLTLKGKRVAGRVSLTGQATLDGEGIPLRVELWGAVGRGTFKLLRTVFAKDDGTFKALLPKSAKQTRFQARGITVEAPLDAEVAAQFCKESFSFLTFPCPTLTLHVEGGVSRTATVK